MVKKLLLEFEDENPYYYIGISASVMDYQVVFDLNKYLNLEFSHAEAFRFVMKGKAYNYTLYLFVDQENLINYYLISNKDVNTRLVPKYKHFDFLIIIDGEIIEEQVKELARNINQLPRIMFSTILEADNIEKIKGFRYEFDKHLDKVLKE